MLKRRLNSLFLVISLVILVFPLAGMCVAKTEVTTENRKLAELPDLMEEGKLNKEYLRGLGIYFEDHFAFKNQLAAMASRILADIFHESNVDTIVVGENDWLYYKDTVNDYRGIDTVSDRGGFNIANNIALMEKKAKEQNAEFEFTVAPNKNSLYGENMPKAYSYQASEVRNIDKVTPYLSSLNVSYTDLFEVFKKEGETLYLKRDSHWNEKGAVLAYNALMDGLEKEHETYVKTTNERRKTKIGDLGNALYSVTAAPEWDYTYQYESGVSFSNDADSWEDEWIMTKSKQKLASGKLLMFRDSFGNSLNKYVAETYKECGFSKNTVYLYDTYLEKMKPNTVIAEIVERNLYRFGQFSLANQHSYGPPVMTATKAELEDGLLKESSCSKEPKASVNLEISDLMPSYYVLCGQVDPEALSVDSKIYVEVTDEAGTEVYDAYTVTCKDASMSGFLSQTEEQTKVQGDDSYYMLYLDSEKLEGARLKVRVLVEQEDSLCQVLEQECPVLEQGMTE